MHQVLLEFVYEYYGGEMKFSLDILQNDEWFQTKPIPADFKIDDIFKTKEVGHC